MTLWDPKKLAEKLGRDVQLDHNNDVREHLRKLYPDHPRHTPWKLDREMIEAVGQQLIQRGKIRVEVLADALAEFEAEAETSGTAALAPITVEPPQFTPIDNDGPVTTLAQRMLRIARDGGSVLTDHDVWTDANIDELVERFVKRPDVSGDGFFTKLDGQLEGASDDVRLLFAEMFLLQMLPLAQFLKSTKISHIQRVLRDAQREYDIPQEVDEALDSPLFGGGQAFAQRRYEQMTVLIEFVRHLRTRTAEEIDRAFKEPLAWRELVRTSPGTREPSLRASLTYLGHPEYFFPLVGVNDKKAIVQAFFPAETGQPASGDLDVDLFRLREWISPSPGPMPNFYYEPLADYWMDYGDEALDDEPVDAEPETYSVESIVEDGAFHSPDELRGIIDRWRVTKNIVLQGPPGTGKTWLARRLAYALMGVKDPDAIRAVQFHPGTSYEDFVRGWRPKGDGTLDLVDGPLLQHAELAREYPDLDFVLVIEEFNRGNPAQTLGEMLTLLEHTKRTESEALELTYKHDAEELFHLPENLYVIGTMNTADRSLALVDFALRRRFAFFELEPQFNDAWQKHLSDKFRTAPASHIGELSRRIAAMNDQIEADPSLGASFRIGHSYFTPETEVSELVPWYRAVVDTSVAPQLREYWHDRPETVDLIVEQLLAEL